MSTVFPIGAPGGGTDLIASVGHLADLVRSNKEPLLSAWRARVRRLRAAEGLDRPTLTDHIPVLLDEMVAAFERESPQAVGRTVGHGSSSIHGLQRFANGFAIEEVVVEYNLLRNCIQELAESHGLLLAGSALLRLNDALDTAVGAAIKAYLERQEQDAQRRREDYLAFVAHDLRTPLGAVAVSAQVIDAETAGFAAGSRLRRVLGTLHRNVEQLAGLVDKILEENANLETGAGLRLERRPLELWPLVEALIADLRPVADPDGTAVRNLVPEDLVVHADASLLRRVFQNLITNAVKHAPGGEIRVSARRGEDGGMIECAVEDNGPGIAPERLRRIFEKFETDGRHAGDLGLGLTICRTFIEAHGGVISAHSEAGSPTVFRFTLPGRAGAH